MTTVNGEWPPVKAKPTLLLTFGCENIVAGGTTRYLYAGYAEDSAQLATAAVIPRGIVVTASGTLKNLFVRHNLANGNGNNVVYNVRVNGIGTPMLVALASGAIGVTSDTVNEVEVVEGDTIDMAVIKPVAVGNGRLAVVATLSLELD